MSKFHHEKCLLAVVLTFLICLVTLTTCDVPGERNQPTGGARVGKLSLMNYEKYKRMFEKHYSSLAEEMRRQKIFISNVLATSIAYLKYKAGRESSYLAVNPMSDWTPEEIASSFKPDKVDWSSSHRSRAKVRSDHGGSQKKAKKESWKSFLAMKKLENAVDDVMHRDLRSCLPEVKNQGMCGSCYIFSTVAMFEWMHCKANESQVVSFSEQYILDCGDGEKFDGCDGGHEVAVMLTLDKIGFDLSRVYPYYAYRIGCPYTNFRKAGRYKMKADLLEKIPRDQWDGQLDKTPILATVRTRPAVFPYYGGGVDDPDNCKHGILHVMLLVGDGTQGGKDYWLLRNTHGPKWGENGYYKLAKQSQCLETEQDGYVPPTSYEFVENPDYDPAILQWHLKKAIFKNVIKFWRLGL